MRTKTLALAAAAALATGPALAADLGAPRPAPPRTPAAVVEQGFDWSGLYIGAQGGYSFGRSSHKFLGSGFDTGDFDTDGGLIGGTLGVNWQTGGLVLGIEGDGAASSIRGSADCVFGPNTYTCETRNKWLATLRGRVGWAAGNWMPYITGGAAFGDIKAAVKDGPIEMPGQRDTRVGWTAGAGLEVALSPNWSVKAEYLYVDLGKLDCDTGNCGLLGPSEVKLNSHVIRGGINYRFNWGGRPGGY